MTRKKPEDLRSHRWLGVSDMRSFGHRSRLRQIGYDADDWTGKPVIGIINTWSEINPCHAHLRVRAENVKRGVLQAGGFPIELPAISLSETVRQAVDHAVPQLPRDGDRGTAAQPSDRRRGADGRLRQDHARPGDGRDQHGRPGDLHSGRPDAARQLGRASTSAPAPTSGNTGPRSAPATSPRTTGSEIEGGIARSFGTCMVMGTAATMMAITEALGLALPGSSSIPAADSNHPRMCGVAGRRIVEMVWEDLTPDKILHARRRSTTPSRSTWRWAARPTRSSMWWRWRGAPASRSTWRRSTGCRGKFRCSPTCGRPANT